MTEKTAFEAAKEFEEIASRIERFLESTIHLNVATVILRDNCGGASGYATFTGNSDRIYVMMAVIDGIMKKKEELTQPERSLMSKWRDICKMMTKSQ